MTPIFEISSSQIASLNDTDLKSLIVLLVKAELNRHDRPMTSVTYGGKQDTRDGGVDVRIKLDMAMPDGYLPGSNIIVQVKATRMGKAAILKELKPQGNLRRTIVELAEIGGTYIIACSREDLTETFLTERVQSMQDAVSEAPKAAALNVRFYDSSMIAGWVNTFPPIALWVFEKIGMAMSNWRPHGKWAGKYQSEFLNDGQASLRYKGPTSSGQKQLDLIEGINLIRIKLREPGSAIRLVGLSGVGKTRLLQALFDPTIGVDSLHTSVALYADSNDSPSPLPTAMLQRLQANRTPAILIVDNCSSQLHHQLVEKLSSKHDISLVTVEYDVSEDKAEGTEVFKLEPASVDLIGKFLARCHPEVPSAIIHKVAAASEGNWRIANLLAENIGENEGAAMSLEGGQLFNRLFWQNKEADSQLRLAAQACSLVYSFRVECEDAPDEELSPLAALAECSPEALYRYVAELKRRDLVQARTVWRALLPHVLARKLAKDALENVPLASIRKHLFTSNLPRLRRSFLKRLGELHDVDRARDLAESFLVGDEWLAQPQAFGTDEIEALELVAPLIQKRLLLFLKNAIESGTFPVSRQSVLPNTIHLLIKLAYEKDLFDEAFGVIIKLLEQISEPVVRSLDLRHITTLFQREISGTNASIEQRLAALQIIADSTVPAVRMLLAQTVDAVLRTVRFSGASISDFGTHSRDYGRRFIDRADYFHWYHSALQWVRNGLQSDELRSVLSHAFAKNVRALLLHTRMTHLLLTICRTIVGNEVWPEGLISMKRGVTALLEHNREEEAILCEATLKNLSPVNLDERLEAYLSDELFNEEFRITELAGNYYQAYEEAIAERSASMAAELLKNPSVLGNNLTKLVSRDSMMLWLLMQELGKRSAAKEGLWQSFLLAYQSLPAHHRKERGLTAFIRGIDGCDGRLADDLINDMLQVEGLERLLVDSLVSIKLTPGRFDKLLPSLQRPNVELASIYSLIGPKVNESLDASQLQDLVAVLLGITDGAHWAIELVHYRLYHWELLSREVPEQDAAIGLMLLKAINPFEHVSDPSRVNYIATHCVPYASTAEAEHILERFKTQTLRNAYSLYNYAKYISALSKKVPDAFLDSLVSEESGSAWQYFLGTFEDLHPHPLHHIAVKRLLSWAEQAPTERLMVLANSAPLWQDENGRMDDEAQENLRWMPLASQLLDAAPDKAATLNVYYKRFSPKSWSNSLVPILKSRLTLLHQMRDWDSQEAKAFAINAIPQFERRIEAEYIRDQELNREFFGQYEY